MLSRSVIDITAYFIYCLFVVTLGTMVNKKLYQNVKNEEHLEKGKIIQRILKTHSLLQIFVWPFIISIAFFLKWNKEILDVIPTAYVGYCIVILRSLNTLNSCFDGFNNATIVHLPQSPLFYISRAFLPSWITYGLKLLWWIILISIHSNLLEGIIYMHIHIYYNR